MLINKDYILSRITFFIVESKNAKAKTKKDLKLYRIKFFFPAWLRKILFSANNPFYAFYKRRSGDNIVSLDTHPITVDFMKYCFENEISFETNDFFPKEDDALIQEHIDVRVKSILSNYSTSRMNEAQEKASRIQKNISDNVKKERGKVNLFYEGIQYYLPQSTFSYTVLVHHYGLRNLPDSIIEYIKGKDFLDIGSLYGDASLMFLQYEPSRIFAYEPVEDSYQNLLKTIQLNNTDKIFAVKKGIGEKTGTTQIAIDTTNAGASTLLNKLSTIETPNVENIEISTIDEECLNKKVGLIKMDIEGFEYYAIKGGLNTIKRDKPVLLISIYHTGKDFFEILPMIKSYVPEYKFRYLDVSPHTLMTDKIVVGYVS